MKSIYGVFFLLTLSITPASSVFAATGSKKVTTMAEFNSVVCSYIEMKMIEGLNNRGVEKLINENAQTIDVLSSIYKNLGCADK